MQAPRVLSVATTLPAHRYSQADVRREATRVFGSDPRLRALLPLFDSCGVDERYFARPLDYYLAPPGFGARNDDFVATAVDLAERCLLDALAAAGLERRQLDHLLFATTTGIATPSVDAILLHRLGLRPDLERTPLFGIGCAAGAVGMARAADLARVRPGSTVALIAVELCSLTFQIRDLSAKNLVGAALFGDGAACVLLAELAGPGPRLTAHRSHTFPDSLEVMGWKVGEAGLELVLSKDLPQLVEREAAPLVERFLAACGLKVDDIDHFVIHPGGPRVVDALERALGLGAGTLDASRRLLRRHGNLSSCSVLFILDELLRDGAPRPGDRGLLVAFGPGFSAELLLLEW